jgi:hypothetical protein
MPGNGFLSEPRLTHSLLPANARQKARKTTGHTPQRGSTEEATTTIPPSGRKQEAMATQTNPTPVPLFKKLFACGVNEMTLMEATEALFDLRGKTASPKQIDQWTSFLLGSYSAEQLAVGFTAAAELTDRFPKVGEVTQAIRDRQFPDDYAYVLLCCKRHYKPPSEYDRNDAAWWKDVGPTYGEQKRRPGATPQDPPETWFLPTEIIQPGIPAPVFEGHLKRALEIFGNGTLRQGWEKLKFHPCAGSWSYEPAEELRIRGGIDREFRAAWQAAWEVR